MIAGFHRSFGRRSALLLAGLLVTFNVMAADDTLRFGVGLYQPDKEKNDATYRPLAEHLARELGRPVKALHRGHLGRAGQVAGRG